MAANREFPKKEGGALATRRSRLGWTLVALVLAAVTIWVVLSQNKEFSFKSLWHSIENANIWYMSAAVACALCIGLAEAKALSASCRLLGYPCRYHRSVVYSAADLYFSAITPSASGGQPLCAALMIRDGIPAAVSTAALLATLSMYTLSLLVMGVIVLLVFPGIFIAVGVTARILIVIGFLVFVCLTSFFLLLLKNEAMLRRICTAAVRFAAKLHLLRRPERTLERLDRSMNEYGESVAILRSHKRMMIGILGYNLLQRLASSLVPFFVALATGASLSQSIHLWAVQIYSMVGANCLPIPGSMGVADFLMLNGFRLYLDESAAVNLELLSRSLSFYFIVILCGTLVLVDHFVHMRRKKK